MSASYQNVTHYFEKCFPHLYPDSKGGPSMEMMHKASHVDVEEVEEDGDDNDSSASKKKPTFANYIKHLMRIRQFNTSTEFMFLVHNIRRKKSILGISAGIHAQDEALNSAGRSGIKVSDFYDVKTANKALLDKLRIYCNSFAVKGTSLFWKDKREDLMSMVRNEVPTFFATLGSGDKSWPTLYHMIDPALVDRDGNWSRECSYDERLNLLASNPTLAVIHFVDRFKAFLKEIILHRSRFNNFCDVVDYWFRIEFQARGSLHAHGMLWTNTFKHASTKLETDEGRNELEQILKTRIFAQSDYKKAITGLPLPDSFEPENFYPKLPEGVTRPPIRQECFYDENKCPSSYCVHDSSTIGHGNERFKSCFRCPGCRFSDTSIDKDTNEYYFDSMECIKRFLTHICNFTCYKNQSKSTLLEDLVCRFHFPKELAEEFKILVNESFSVLNERRYKLDVKPKRETFQVY